MKKFERTLLIAEFEQFLSDHVGSNWSRDLVFSKIMQTKRQFRADYYLYDYHIIIEINGGQWINGRHNHAGKGYENDLIKSNLANRNGCYYLQYTYEMMRSAGYKDDIMELVKK